MLGEREYNLNALIEIEASEAFLGLDQNVRDCHIKEPFHNCTTRMYIDTLLRNCGCLPLNMRLDIKV